MFTNARFGILALAMLALATVAYAENRSENDTVAAPARVSLAQAVALAEQHTNGRASRAILEQTRAGSVYEVEIVTPGQVLDVSVNAESGAIVSAREDAADSGRNEDEHDDD